MKTRFYVGNLSYQATADDLRKHFEPHTVGDAKVIVDRDTGKSRGFGFVEIEGDPRALIEEFDGSDIMGRSIIMNEAREKQRDDRRDRRQGRDR